MNIFKFIVATCLFHSVGVFSQTDNNHSVNQLKELQNSTTTVVSEEDVTFQTHDSAKPFLIIIPRTHEKDNEGHAIHKVSRFAKRSEEGHPILLDSHDVHNVTAIVAALEKEKVQHLKREFPNAIIAEDGPVWASAVQVQNNPPWGLSRIVRRWLHVNDQDVKKFDDDKYANDKPYIYDDNLFSKTDDLMIYILDTGVDSSLKNEMNLIMGPTFIDGTSTANDDNGHGTVVGGIIGSKSFGVAKGAPMTFIKALDKDERASWSVVIRGLSWISNDIRSKNYKRVIINMSINGQINRAAEAALNAMVEANVTIVASAGNLNENACNNCPGNMDSVIVVGASNKLDERWNESPELGSNFGSCVDIFAPGQNVLSTVPSSTGKSSGVWSGTSMAAPHVAGVAATLMAKNGFMDPNTTKQAIINVSTSNVLNQENLFDSPNKMLFAFSPESAVSCPPILKLDDMSDSGRLFGKQLTSNGAPATDNNSCKRKFLLNTTDGSSALVLVPSSENSNSGSFYSFSFTNYANAISSSESCFDASTYDFLSFGFRGPSGAEVYIQATIGDIPSKCNRLAFKMRLKVQDYMDKVDENDLMNRNKLQAVNIPLRDFCKGIANSPNVQIQFGNREDVKWCLKGLQRLSIQDFTVVNGYDQYAFSNLKLYSTCHIDNAVSSAQNLKVTLPNLRSSLIIEEDGEIFVSRSKTSRRRRGEDDEFMLNDDEEEGGFDEEIADKKHVNENRPRKSSNVDALVIQHDEL